MYLKYDRKLKRYRDSSGRFISKEKAQEFKREIKKIEKYGKNYLKAKKIGIVFDAKTKKYRDINTGKFIKTEEALKKLEGRRSIYIISSKSGKIYRNKYWQDKEKKIIRAKKRKNFLKKLFELFELNKEITEQGIVKTISIDTTFLFVVKNDIFKIIEIEGKDEKYLKGIYREGLIKYIQKLRRETKEKEHRLYFYMDIELQKEKDEEIIEASYGTEQLTEKEKNTYNYIDSYLDYDVLDFFSSKYLMMMLSDMEYTVYDIRLVFKEWTNPQKHY